MRAAAMGIATTGIGTVATGPAAASTQEDGPGQEIPTPPLEVDGNVLVDPEGNTVTLRGFNVADPKTLNLTASVRGKRAQDVLRYVTNREEGFYPRVIRLPIEPGSVAELTPVPLADYENGDYPIGAFDREDLLAYCRNHLDQAVDVCEERNVYCILDYHRHWGDGEQEWTDPDLDPEVKLFWDVIADRYGDRDHVIFELYNEPTEPGMWNDPKDSSWASTWFEWVNTAQPWLDKIREYTDTPVFIGSPSWTQSPEGALLTPETTRDYLQDDFVQFEDPAENIGFTYHIYPAHRVSKQAAWDDPSVNGGGVDQVYEEYPLFVTEFGWDGALDGRYNYSTPYFPLEGTTSGFGESFVEWLESSPGINWTAWCADPVWKPVMMERTFTERTQFDDVDAAGDPYDGELPVYCEEPPCEWGLMGEDVGDYDLKAGGFIRETLEANRDHNVPQVGGGGDEAPPAPSDLSVDVSSGDGTATLSWSAVSEAESYAVSVNAEQRTTTEETSAQVSGIEAGTYEFGVAAVAGGESSELATRTIEIDPPAACPDGQQSVSVGDRVVCDPDGDDLFEDLNADGNATHADVQEFFAVQHRPAWKQPQYFDFNGNEVVGHGDVIALFRDVATGGL